MLEKVRHITIVGTGLLGASLGLALKQRGYAGRIAGVGRRRATVERAIALGAVDEVSDDLQATVARSDLAVVAVPLGQFEAVFRAIGEAAGAHLIVTDVGSTKSQVCASARQHLGAARFVGSHPMAGSEKQGPDAADADLFHGKPCVLTPEPATDEQALGMVRALWQALGMRLLTMTPTEHDERVAFISHLPHVLAVLMVELAAEHGAMDVASTGFGDTTRIASGDPQIWADVFGTNREAVLRAIDALAQRLAEARQVVAGNDREQMRRWLEDTKCMRDGWGQESETRI